MGIGDWGLGIGDWGLGIGPNPQSPIPNPLIPIPKPNHYLININFILYNKKMKIRLHIKIANFKKFQLKINAPSIHKPSFVFPK
jgi:hypothetical protein